jgi:hypothetical protein
MMAAAGMAARAMAPMALNALGNVASSAIGNAASRAGTAGRNYDDVLEAAERSGANMQELANAAADRAQRRGQDETRFQQGVGMENLSFSRGLNADQMRQQTYNSMAQNEQNNRAGIAQGLLSDYSQARNNATNLMANTLRF